MNAVVEMYVGKFSQGDLAKNGSGAYAFYSHLTPFTQTSTFGMNITQVTSSVIQSLTAVVPKQGVVVITPANMLGHHCSNNSITSSSQEVDPTHKK